MTVNFLMAQGTGLLSAPSATTNGSGYAAVTLTLTSFTGNVLLNACVAPANNPCQTISANGVSPALLSLHEVAGAGQVIAGQTFQPVTVRVTDSSMPPNPILGASVIFSSTLMRPVPGDPIGTAGGDPVRTNPGMPVILGASQMVVASDVNGLASLVPSTGGFGAPVEIAIIVSAGTSALLQYDLESLPAMAGGGDGSAVVADFQKMREKPASSWRRQTAGSSLRSE